MEPVKTRLVTKEINGLLSNQLSTSLPVHLIDRPLEVLTKILFGSVKNLAELIGIHIASPSSRNHIGQELIPIYRLPLPPCNVCQHDETNPIFPTPELDFSSRTIMLAYIAWRQGEPVDRD